jgi:cytochrome c oxidase assembly protein subunit 15
MPFDVRDFPGAPPEDRAAGRGNRRRVAAWLFAVASMILVMIVLGGVTRLTGSGLSIMEWAPFAGALPPMSDADWQRLYHLYQQIPQYALVNQGFGLAGFKQIFWLEWSHRLWGRLIGFAFLVPLIWFWATGRIERRLRPRLVLLFVLGGMQGAVGWFMVASGFQPDTTAVSPYRLVIHLALALVLYVALVWTGLTVLRPLPHGPAPSPLLRRMSWLCCTFIGVTILAGGFVAGTHAGFTYNPVPPDGWQPAPVRLRVTPADLAQSHGKPRDSAVRPSLAGDIHRGRGDLYPDHRFHQPSANRVTPNPGGVGQPCGVSVSARRRDTSARGAGRPGSHAPGRCHPPADGLCRTVAYDPSSAYRAPRMTPKFRPPPLP